MFDLHFRPLLIYRYASIVLILVLFYLMVLLWNQGDMRNTLIISIFLVIGIKYFQGVLITSIDINKDSIVLGRSFGKIKIAVKEVKKLAIRYVQSSEIDEFPEAFKYLEISTNSGKHYIYPMTSGRKSLRENEIKLITGLDFQQLPKLHPRITNRYLTFNLWV